MGILTQRMKGATAPMAQVQGNKVNSFEELLNSKKELFYSILKSQDPKRFLSVAIQIASDKKLASCTPESILNCFLGIAQYDLSPGIGGEAYIIPYKNVATLQIGYKGYRQLLYRSGWIVNAHPVYKCDKFTYKIDGTKTLVSLEPDFMARQEDNKEWVFQNLNGIFITAKDDFGREIFGFVSKRVIEKLRLTSANQTYIGHFASSDAKKIKAGQPVGIWEDWYEEMAMAKAIKKFSKNLPISDERVKKFINNDDKIEIGNYVDFEKEIVVDDVKEDNQSSEKVVQLIQKVQSLGFECTGPTEKNGVFFLMATPLREDSDFHSLVELGFGQVNNKLVMKVSHLM